jgi:RHS repeat-associated protein
MTTTKSYDYLNRLLSISSINSQPSTINSFSYQYNDANQRVTCRLADGSYWVYLYDSLGQVISGKKYFPDGIPVPGQQFEYGFDDIGNRNSTKAGGDENGSNLRTANYSANNLNQYTSRDAPGAVDIIGAALASSTVSVNNNSPYRRIEYFRQELSVNNSSAPQWQSVTVTASGQSPNATGNIYVPKTPEQFTYDADGNLLTDGRWTYTWDAENRLLSMSAISTVPTAAKLKLDFIYDYRGRRIQKTVSTWNGSAYVSPVVTRFLYDRWNLIAILNSSSSVLQSFLWGTDLSGTSQGAGGVGGLLAIGDSAQGTHFVAFDGNGNVAALVKATDGTASAIYEYGPFGEAFRVTGVMSKGNCLRFSTQYQDDETDLLMYSRRPYSAAGGRFLTRDPIGENGGVGLYNLVANEPLDEVDPLGLCKIKIRCNPVREFGITVGWHCGVIAPDGTQYDIGGVGILGSSGGSPPVVYPIGTNPPPPVPPPYKDYPVSCGGCCDSIQKCLQNYHDTVTPPTYHALGPNSNTYAHNMLNACGCSVDPIRLPCYTVLRSPKEGRPYTVCPGPTTTPPGAVGWNDGF